MVQGLAVQAAFPPSETGIHYYPGGKQRIPCMKFASLFGLCFSNQNYFTVKNLNKNVNYFSDENMSFSFFKCSKSAQQITWLIIDYYYILMELNLN